MRLFNKYAITLSYNKSPKYDKMKEQVDYAKENIESIRTATSKEQFDKETDLKNTFLI